MRALRPLRSCPSRGFVGIQTTAARRGDRYGSALQSITPRKQRKLREVAQHYVQTVDWAGPWRIDVIAVQLDSSGKLLDVEHIRHAVTGD